MCMQAHVCMSASVFKFETSSVLLTKQYLRNGKDLCAISGKRTKDTAPRIERSSQS